MLIRGRSGYVAAMSRSRHPKLLAMAATVFAVALVGVSSALELKAPWSGTTLVASALSLVLAGYWLRRAGHILGLAAGLPAFLLLVDLALLDNGVEAQPLKSGSCDPTCGIFAGSGAILLFVAVLVLGSAGGLVRAAATRQ